MRDSLRSPWVWAPPGAAALLFVLVLATGSNQSVFLWLNRAGHAVDPTVWLHLTMLGDGGVALALVLPAIRRAPRAFWAALAAAVFTGLWTQVTKQVIDLPRPLGVFAPEAFYQTGPAYRHVSFPSGHAAAAFALAGIWVMGVCRHPLLRAALLATATLVGLSRIMVGVHWPLDVLWGMLGGWIGAWLGLAMHGRWRWRTSGLAGFLAGALLLAVSAWLLVSRHIGVPAIVPMQRVIGCVCLVWGAWEILRMAPRITWWRARKRRWDG
jgi:membrane-associated phospholipid phosphatase